MELELSQEEIRSILGLIPIILYPKSPSKFNLDLR